MEKLKLNDASLTFEPESSMALGFGFRCGFLGMLHMEIIQERLDREFNMNVITTVPNVSYYAYTKNETILVNNPSDLPEANHLERVEPFIKAQIITDSKFIGPIMNLCIEKRGILKNQVYITTDRVEITLEMPLLKLYLIFMMTKSISKGYASFDYQPLNMQCTNLTKVDILLNGEQVDALSSLIYRDNAYNIGKKMCVKLKSLIPRQFDIAIQGAIGSKMLKL